MQMICNIITTSLTTAQFVITFSTLMQKIEQTVTSPDRPDSSWSTTTRLMRVSGMAVYLVCLAPTLGAESAGHAPQQFRGERHVFTTVMPDLELAPDSRAILQSANNDQSFARIVFATSKRVVPANMSTIAAITISHAVVVGAGASITTSSEPTSDISIRIDRVGYRVGEPIHVTILNNGMQTVVVPAGPLACALIIVEQRYNDRWQAIGHCRPPALAIEEIELPPAARLEGNLGSRGNEGFVLGPIKGDPVAPQVLAGGLGGLPNADPNQIVSDVPEGEARAGFQRRPFSSILRALVPGQYRIIVQYEVTPSAGLEIRRAYSPVFAVTDTE
ncbi:MAG: hypothetical protein ACREEE_14165 [Dongiaceae bacterium]